MSCGVHHCKNCKYRHWGKDGEDEREDLSFFNTNIVAQSRMLLEGWQIYSHGPMSKYERVKTIIVSHMQESESIKSTILSDDLILQFGNLRLERLGESRRGYIGQQMRQLGRIVKQMRQLTGNKVMTFSQCLDPKHFDNVVTATKQLSKVDKNAKTMNGVVMSGSPSFGLQVGHALAQVCMLKVGRAVRANDRVMKEALSFAELHSSEWTDLIAARLYGH